MSQAPALGTRSVGRNAMSRLAADASGAALGLITGAVTARELGPAGKGVLAAALFLVTVGSRTATLGLAEAAIVRIGQGRETLQTASASALGVALPISAGVGGVLALATFLTLRPAHNVPLVLVVAGVVPVLSVMHVFVMLVNSQERILTTSGSLLAGFAVTALATVAFVSTLRLGVFGAVLAQLVGGLAAVSVLAVALARLGVRPFGCRIGREFLASAFRLGAVLELSQVVIALSQRLDQVMVLVLAGKADAGVYAVALTLGQLVIYAPFALSVAVFPRLARAGQEEVHDLLLQTARVGAGAALMGAAVVASAIPLAVPIVFGPGYTDAVLPGIILSFGGVLWTEQWLVCRAVAARGMPGLLLRSYVLSLSVMLALDVALVLTAGVIGAALASVLGSAAGLGYVVARVNRRLDRPLAPLDLAPRPSDLLAVILAFRPARRRSATS